MKHIIFLTAKEAAALAAMMRSIDVAAHLVELGKRWPGVTKDNLIDGKASLVDWLESMKKPTHAERNRRGWEFIAWACDKTLKNWPVRYAIDLTLNPPTASERESSEIDADVLAELRAATPKQIDAMTVLPEVVDRQTVMF